MDALGPGDEVKFESDELCGNEITLKQVTSLPPALTSGLSAPHMHCVGSTRVERQTRPCLLGRYVGTHELKTRTDIGTFEDHFAYFEVTRVVCNGTIPKNKTRSRYARI